MILQQFYLKSLGHASYLVGSEQTGEALVLDPRRDIDIYLQEARLRGLRLRYVVETHVHDDYLTGGAELALRAGAERLVGVEAPISYEARRLSDREQLQMGEILIEVLHTPGHTSEHISLLLTDRSRGDEPSVLLSGGAFPVAGVGRSDLLGEAQEIRHLAQAFCSTLRERLLRLPDHLEVHPTHVAASFCGAGARGRLSTTVGYERRVNRLLDEHASCPVASSEKGHACVFLERERALGSRSSCVDLAQMPSLPAWWRRIRSLNQQGPPLLGVLEEPPALRAPAFEASLRDGAQILDCRNPEGFAVHIPDAVNVPLGDEFPAWVGTMLDPDLPVLVVVDDPRDLWDVCWSLLRIGFGLPRGWLAGGMRAWRTAGRPLRMMSQWTVIDLAEELARNPRICVLDVRQPGEWATGHIHGAVHIAGSDLPDRIDEVPRDRPVAVVCGSGYRSSVCSSLLVRRGVPDVRNVAGGLLAWKDAGLPLARMDGWAATAPLIPPTLLPFGASPPPR